MNSETFTQLRELQESGSVNMADLKGLARIAEELEYEELSAELKKIMSKDCFERSRDFQALMQAFGEGIKKDREEEDPNEGKGDETPQSEARGPDDPPEAKEAPGPGSRVDEAGEPIVHGEPDDKAVDDGGTELKKATEEDEE